MKWTICVCLKLIAVIALIECRHLDDVESDAASKNVWRPLSGTTSKPIRGDETIDNKHKVKTQSDTLGKVIDVKVGKNDKADSLHEIPHAHGSKFQDDTVHLQEIQEPLHIKEEISTENVGDRSTDNKHTDGLNGNTANDNAFFDNLGIKKGTALNSDQQNITPTDGPAITNIDNIQTGSIPDGKTIMATLNEHENGDGDAKISRNNNIVPSIRNEDLSQAIKGVLLKQVNGKIDQTNDASNQNNNDDHIENNINVKRHEANGPSPNSGEHQWDEAVDKNKNLHKSHEISDGIINPPRTNVHDLPASDNMSNDKQLNEITKKVNELQNKINNNNDYNTDFTNVDAFADPRNHEVNTNNQVNSDNLESNVRSTDNVFNTAGTNLNYDNVGEVDPGQIDAFNDVATGDKIDQATTNDDDIFSSRTETGLYDDRNKDQQNKPSYMDNKRKIENGIPDNRPYHNDHNNYDASNRNVVKSNRKQDINNLQRSSNDNEQYVNNSPYNNLAYDQNKNIFNRQYNYSKNSIGDNQNTDNNNPLNRPKVDNNQLDNEQNIGNYPSNYLVNGQNVDNNLIDNRDNRRLVGNSPVYNRDNGQYVGNDNIYDRDNGQYADDNFENNRDNQQYVGNDLKNNRYSGQYLRNDAINNRDNEQYAGDYQTSNRKNGQYVRTEEANNRDNEQYVGNYQTGNRDNEQYVGNYQTSNRDNEQHVGNYQTGNRDNEQYVGNYQTGNRAKEQHVGNYQTGNRDNEQYVGNYQTGNRDNEQYFGNYQTSNRDSEQYVGNYQTGNRDNEQHVGNYQTGNRDNEQYVGNYQTGNRYNEQYVGNYQTGNRDNEQYGGNYQTGNRDNEQYLRNDQANNRDNEQYVENYQTSNRDNEQYLRNDQANNRDNGQYVGNFPKDSRNYLRYVGNDQTNNHGNRQYVGNYPLDNRNNGQYVDSSPTYNRNNVQTDLRNNIPANNNQLRGQVNNNNNNNIFSNGRVPNYPDQQGQDNVVNTNVNINGNDRNFDNNKYSNLLRPQYNQAGTNLNYGVIGDTGGRIDQYSRVPYSDNDNDVNLQGASYKPDINNPQDLWNNNNVQNTNRNRQIINIGSNAIPQNQAAMVQQNLQPNTDNTVIQANTKAKENAEGSRQDTPLQPTPYTTLAVPTFKDDEWAYYDDEIKPEVNDVTTTPATKKAKDDVGPLSIFTSDIKYQRFPKPMSVKVLKEKILGKPQKKLYILEESDVKLFSRVRQVSVIYTMEDNFLYISLLYRNVFSRECKQIKKFQMGKLMGNTDIAMFEKEVKDGKTERVLFFTENPDDYVYFMSCTDMNTSPYACRDSYYVTLDTTNDPPNHFPWTEASKELKTKMNLTFEDPRFIFNFVLLPCVWDKSVER